MIVKGYVGKVGINEANKLSSQGIYVFNSLAVGGKEHLEYSFLKAKNAFERGINIANSLHIETMLILTGSRQIKTAIKLAGINENVNKIAAISEKNFELPLKRDDYVVKCTPQKLKYMGIDFIVPNKECDAFFENSAMLYLKR